MTSPQEIIEDIQLNKYGIGLKTDSTTKGVIEGLKNSLNSALELLSEGLYSKETHFVLELIQNADDNDYEEGVIPLLKFTIDHEKILIQNNERGFIEENIRALCDVGRSTKRKFRGYIGEKGIGFKSVFLVSDTPQIFSNGFYFKFYHKDEHNKLGFVVPYWIDEIPEFIDKKLTNIVLPFREDIKEELSIKFDDIESTLLLFLHKLKRVEIHNVAGFKPNIIARHDRNNGRVEIEHSDNKQCWKLVRKPLEVLETIREEKREGVKETDLTLAFPLEANGTAHTVTEQQVFAFLPTRSYGFKFIIQADFLVPSNREDIHKDKTWNTWLRDNIACVFLNAVSEFKQEEQLSKSYYNYIPLLKEVSDHFFSIAVEQIHNALKEAECILTESGNWRRPAKVFLADDGIRELISNEDLKTFFDNEYIFCEIKAESEILKTLGVQKFDIDHLIQCLQQTDWIEKQDDKWLVKLYIYLNDKKLKDEKLQEISKLNIIRLESGQLASISEGSVFFPLDKKSNYGFEKELRVIKKTLMDAEEKEDKDAVTAFLKQLNVRDAYPFEIIENYILPIYESEHWKDKTTDTLLGYVTYAKDHFEDYKKENDKHLNANKKSGERKEDPIRRLKDSLYIRISKTVDNTDHYNHPENTYLPKIYGNENDLEILFEGIENVYFVHREYINGIINKYRQEKRKGKKKKTDIQKKRNTEIKEWKDCFLKLGVNEIPKIVCKSDKIHDPFPQRARNYGYNDSKLQYKSYLQDEYFKNLNDPYKAFEEIEDYTLEIELQQLSQKQRELLLIIIDKNWDYYKKFFSKQLVYKYGYSRSNLNWNEDKKDCYFKHSLINTSWLPINNDTIVKPSEVFLDKPEIRELLGDNVPYITIDVKNEEFIKAVGINSTASVEGVLNYLKGLVENECSDKTVFTKLYDFLSKNYGNNEDIIKTSFSQNQIIYLPDTNKKYFTSQEVLWKDVSDIFGENRGYLGKHYIEYKSFFIEKVDVSEKPVPKDYANVLIDLSKKEKIAKEDEKVIFKIYEELNTHLNPEDNELLISEEDWWNDFIKKPIFWTDKEEFWNNENDVFINDNEGIYELLKNNPRLAFLKLRQNYHPKIGYFITASGISYLSKSLTHKLTNSKASKIEQDLTNRIQKFIPYVLRYLYQLDYITYEKLKKDGILAQLKNLMCYSMEDLQVEYALNKETIITHRKVILYDGNLYIQTESLEDSDHLAVELSKIFGKPKGLDDFIISLFNKETSEKIDNLMRAKGIHELPDEERAWFGVIKPALEKVELEEPKNIDETNKEIPKVIVSNKISDALATENISALSGNVEWQPECEPDEAEIYTEDFQVPKPIDYKTSDVRVVTGKDSPTFSDEENNTHDILSPKAKRDIGMWGEEYAIKYLRETLCAKYPEGKVQETEYGFSISLNEQIIVEVHWLNKKGDRGEGCDIKINETGNEEYIEVKSTKTDAKEWFDLSRKQWEVAKGKEDKFHIYRIFNAGTKNAKLVDIQNPSKLWQEGSLTAYPVRLQI